MPVSFASAVAEAASKLGSLNWVGEECTMELSVHIDLKTIIAPKGVGEQEVLP